jgi:hypothetical protein
MPHAPRARRLRLAAALAAAGLAACGDPRPRARPPPPPPLAFPVAVSGASPYPAGCNSLPGAASHRGSAVEPSLAVDPASPLHLVAAWQQDRWSLGGGADGIATAVSLDGGLTWTPGLPPLTLCAGGALPRATDPWLSFAPDGVVHLVALGLDDPWLGRRQAILASRSADGGLTWSDPASLASASTADIGLDKCSLIADPGRPGYLYAVWDRLTGLGGPAAAQTGPAWLGRSLDGGATWEPARAIFDPGPDAQTISNQVAVLPDGTLVDLLVIVQGLSGIAPAARVAVLRSGDAGATWSPPVDVAALLAIGASDPKTGYPVRDGSLVPQIAADPAAGALHVVWQDARFSAGARDGIALSTSTDGGLSWSPPVQVNRHPAAQAFTPAAAVGPGGRLAVSYYDFRADDPRDPGSLWTVLWLATSPDGGASWDEVPLGGPFDLRLAPDVGGLFLGDYHSLAAPADSFLALFSMSGPAASSARVFAGPAPGAAAARAAPAAGAPEQRVPPRPLAERLRALRERAGGARGPRDR